MKVPHITKILKYIIIFSLIFVAIYTFVDLVYKPWKEQRDWQREVDAWQAEIERPYREDTVGGDTPEETLAMFIQALKEEDLDYASKFFVLDKQEEWRENLGKIQEAGHLGDMVGDLEGAEPKGSLYEGNFQFKVLDSNGRLGALVDISKSINGKWKISSL